MQKIIIALFLVSLTASAHAQQVVMICYQNPGQNPVCQPVDSTHPLPVAPQ